MPSAPLRVPAFHPAIPSGCQNSRRCFGPKPAGPPRRPPPCSPGGLEPAGPQSPGLACTASAARTKRPRPPGRAGPTPSPGASRWPWRQCCRRGGAGRGWASPPRSSSAPSWRGRSSATPCRPWRGNAAPSAPHGWGPASASPPSALRPARSGRPAAPSPAAALARGRLLLADCEAVSTVSVTRAWLPFPLTLQRWTLCFNRWAVRLGLPQGALYVPRRSTWRGKPAHVEAGLTGAQGGTKGHSF